MDYLPDQIYVDRFLHLPLSKLPSEASLIRNLCFPDFSQNPPGIIRLYELGPTHVTVPRSYLLDYKLVGRKDVVDLRPRSWPQIEIRDRIQLRDDGVQEPALQALLSRDQNRDKIVVVRCGGGKTLIALKGVAARRVPTMIVVPAGLLPQWREAIRTFLDVESVGVIHGSKKSWDHPIVLSSLETLARWAVKGQIPHEWSRYFGLWVFDEIHALGASTFRLVSDLGMGERWGLTATDTREDAQEYLYYYTVGPVLFRGQALPATLRVVRTGFPVPMDQVKQSWGGVDNTELMRILAEDPDRQQLLVWYLLQLLDEGRTVLAFSQRLSQLDQIQEGVQAAGATPGRIDGRTPFRERKQILSSHDLTLAITRTGKLGLDREDRKLDTCVFLLPERAENSMDQGIGRAQRNPDRRALLVVFQDENPICRHKIRKVIDHCRGKRWQVEYTKMEVR